VAGEASILTHPLEFYSDGGERNAYRHSSGPGRLLPLGTSNFLGKYGESSGIPKNEIVVVMWMVMGIMGAVYFLHGEGSGETSATINLMILVPILAGVLSGLGFMPLIYGVTSGKTGVVTANANVVVTVVLALLVISETPGIKELAGIAIVVVGVVVLSV